MGERIQTKESIYLNKFYHMIFNFIQKFNHLNQNLKTSFCKKIHLRKKRLDSNQSNNILNLLNEPQNLAEIKTSNLLKIPNKRVTKFRERKLRNKQLKFCENKQEKYTKNFHVSFFIVEVRVLRRDWLICEITCTVHTKWEEGGKIVT